MLRKEDILRELGHAIEEAGKKQGPDAKRDSGRMTGLKEAQRIIEGMEKRRWYQLWR